MIVNSQFNPVVQHTTNIETKQLKPHATSIRQFRILLRFSKNLTTKKSPEFWENIYEFTDGCSLDPGLIIYSSLKLPMEYWHTRQA